MAITAVVARVPIYRKGSLSWGRSVGCRTIELFWLLAPCWFWVTAVIMCVVEEGFPQWQVDSAGATLAGTTWTRHLCPRDICWLLFTGLGYVVNKGNYQRLWVYGARELQFSHNTVSHLIIPMPLSTIFNQLPLCSTWGQCRTIPNIICCFQRETQCIYVYMFHTSQHLVSIVYVCSDIQSVI